MLRIIAFNFLNVKLAPKQTYTLQIHESTWHTINSAQP